MRAILGATGLAVTVAAAITSGQTPTAADRFGAALGDTAT
jgi:hypothetical protein